MRLHFYKYQGAGNDFVLIDNRVGEVEYTEKIVGYLCDRRFGVGADGLMLLQKSSIADFEMVYFMVGYSHAKLLADVHHVPLVEVSHQQGHVAASLWSAGRLDLMDVPHLAWHLSGGTTELLLVEPEGKNVRCTRIGGTTDISAGQLIDRTGQLLNLPFPAGKHLDALSQSAALNDVFKVKCPGLEFSLSGVQNKIQQYNESHTPEETAGYALRCVCAAVLAATKNALKLYPGYQVVFSGGVASNSMLRSHMAPLNPVFSEPQYSTDNAMGVAVLAKRLTEG